MSRRYGRNKKRRDRARIADLENQVGGLKYRVREGELSKDKLRTLERDIQKVVPNSALLESSIHHEQRDNGMDSYRMAYFKPQRRRSFGPPNWRTDLPLREHIDMERLRILIQEDFERGERATHIIIRYADSGLQYYVSEEAMRMGLDRVRETVAEVLSHELCEYWARTGRHEEV